MTQLYVLIYTDICTCDFRIFNNLNDAVKIFLKHSINETKKILEIENSDEIKVNEDSDKVNEDLDEIKVCSEDSDEIKVCSEDLDEIEVCSSSNIEDEMKCILQIQEIRTENNEYISIKDFDIDFFQEYVEKKEDIEEYFIYLEENIEKNTLPSDILEIFSK